MTGVAPNSGLDEHGRRTVSADPRIQRGAEKLASGLWRGGSDEQYHFLLYLCANAVEDVLDGYEATDWAGELMGRFLDVVNAPGVNRTLMPWPEAPQDVAFIARTLDTYRAKLHAVAEVARNCPDPDLAQKITSAVTGAPSITCPKCSQTSYNPNDIRERYCGACGYHDGSLIK